MARKQNRKSPRHKLLSVKVTREGVLTIEIGVDALAFAALASEHAWTMANEKTDEPDSTRPDTLFRVTNARGFAKDIAHALTDEAEDGSTLLTKVIDDAARVAIEDGSEFFLGNDEEL